MPTEIFLSPTGYKKFIIAFRNACIGRPAGTFEAFYTRLDGGVTSFRFRTSDEYLVGVNYSGTWRTITDSEGHYAHMGPKPGSITYEAIVSAMSTNFDNNINEWHGKLYTVICVTAEAARSEVVYNACQLAMHNNGTTLEYLTMWPYINTYDKNRKNEGIGATTFRALKASQYRVVK